ncbi:hypothetical protein JTB14_020771 [Gonioctena quinquepunctata]|nr:hypothetical protein JTB14_020771 [Gonioctena quinquepunctata]
MPINQANLGGAELTNSVAISGTTSLLEFIPSDPEMWFTMVELQFSDYKGDGIGTPIILELRWSLKNNYLISLLKWILEKA